MDVQPQELTFTHVVGQSPCPQLVGRVTIRNNGGTPFTTDLRSVVTAPLSFGPDQTVQPGQSVTIDVFFTCAGQTSFVASVDTLSPQDGGGGNAVRSQFVVRGTIVR